MFVLPPASAAAISPRLISGTSVKRSYPAGESLNKYQRRFTGGNKAVIPAGE